MPTSLALLCPRVDVDFLLRPDREALDCPVLDLCVKLGENENTVPFSLMPCCDWSDDAPRLKIALISASGLENGWDVLLEPWVKHVVCWFTFWCIAHWISLKIPLQNPKNDKKFIQNGSNRQNSIFLYFLPPPPRQNFASVPLNTKRMTVERILQWFHVTLFSLVWDLCTVLPGLALRHAAKMNDSISKTLSSAALNYVALA